MGLSGVERRLERLVEGGFAKVFRSGLEPVEIGRRLVRELDRSRQRTAQGVVAPNHLVVRLSAEDLERFAGYAESLVAELEASARDHAREEGYGFLGPVVVELQRDRRLGPGALEVQGSVVAAAGSRVASLVLAGGRRVTLGDAPTTLGREPQCEVVLDDPTVSRRHAEVRRAEAGFEVVDLGSRNGTRVNGRGVSRWALRDGDEIRVGAVAVRYEAV